MLIYKIQKFGKQYFSLTVLQKSAILIFIKDIIVLNQLFHKIVL